ncbi:MAG: EAL domain-containing protein [Campylobacterota bacterium]|nr:EAL domain-containing protein [Campylobacterota bacterium]
MKGLNTYYSSKKKLKEFIDNHEIKDSKSLLIQVFTAYTTEEEIRNLLDEITFFLPQAVIIGSTTDGEIMNGKVSTNKTVLSFTQFEHTRLKSSSLEHTSDSYESGKLLAQELIEEDTKLIIAFADGLHTNGSTFLEGIYSVDKGVKIAGGLAGDGAVFSKTYIFDKKRILSKGAVAVSCMGKSLLVNTSYSFNWRAIGKELVVTHAEGNRIFTIDNRTALDTYAHYLGERVARSLPKIGVEFPLIVKRQGMYVARAVMAKHEDGSLTFAGDLLTGDKVQFGHGDTEEILYNSRTLIKSLYKTPAEVNFIYSCMARRRFMDKDIEVEIFPLQDIAITSGFFTYGEFYTAKKPELLNQTMTIVSITEKENFFCPLPAKSLDYEIKEDKGKNALIHLLDVVNRESKEQEGIERERKAFEMMFEKSPDGMLIIKNNKFIRCNQKMMQMLNYKSKEELLALKPGDFTPEFQPNGERSLDIIEKMLNQTLEEGEQFFELTYKKAGGELFWAEVMMIAIIINDERVIKVVYRDISHRKDMEQLLSSQKDILYYQARHDVLTGLPNRTLFTEKLEEGIKRSLRKNKILALMFIDLDQFKAINDSLGHAIGDMVLRKAAARLSKIVGKHNSVYRLGGDEFTVIMENIKKKKDISILAEKVLKILQEPIVSGIHILHISGSIGIGICPDNAKNISDLLKNSDVAMYKAKELGGNRFTYYKKEMGEFAYARLTMKSDLYKAIENNEFEIHYQPQIDVNTDKIVGLEALIRWKNPKFGLVPPIEFLPLAHEIGIIVVIDWWVMETSMRQIKLWHDSGLYSGTLALNFTLKQLESDTFITQLQEIMQKTGFESHWLELEIPESEVMRNPENVISKLKALKALNINISIDDFGTGYSSLSYLKRLPIHKLKIDGSFMYDIPKDRDAMVIVETIITLARSLSLEVIAEGVETKEQRDFLVNNHCNHIQGYFYSKPIPVDDVSAMLNQRNF